jgi:hypothetical protein
MDMNKFNSEKKISNTKYMKYKSVELFPILKYQKDDGKKMKVLLLTYVFINTMK